MDTNLYWMGETIVHYSEDQCARQMWTFSTGYGAFLHVSLTEYRKEIRRSRRHRQWECVEIWPESAGRRGTTAPDGPSSMPTIPDDVRDEIYTKARDHIVLILPGQKVYAPELTKWIEGE